ncbi:MAG: leucyl aminopeptidase [candidate division GAL15 bacterium]
MADPAVLRRSAHNLLLNAAGVRPGEGLCVVADTQTRPIADVLFEVAREVGAEPVLVCMVPRRTHGNEPPPVVAGAMRGADVVIQAVTYAITHTDATQEALRAGARVLVLRGVTEDVLTGGAALADYGEVARITKAVAERLTQACTAHVRTPAGTDLVMSLEGRTAIALTGRVEGPGTFAAMPDGEAAIAPVEGTAEGILVVEHTMDGIGPLEEPIRLVVRQGRVVEVTGGEAATRLRALLHGADKDAVNLAEFAIGTNRWARLIGSMTEDKKRWGTVHVAVGDNHVIGGHVTSELHLDGLLLRPTVTLDGQVVVEDGRLLIGG